MAFDFSSYLPPPPGQGSTTASAPPQTMGALPAGITPADAQQMFAIQQSPIADDPALRQITDSEGNAMGSFQTLDPQAYKDQEAQWQEQQKLQQAGLLTGPQVTGGADGSNTQTIQHLGTAAPAAFSGHDDYSPNTPQGTLAGEGARIDSTNYLPDMANGLVNKQATFNDPNWGPLTMAANVDQKHPLGDTFMKYAPLLVGALAGGAGLAFGGLADAGGATAGMLVGDQTASEIGGGALNGITATSSDLLANAPAWLTKALGQTAKGLPGALNSSGGGKFDFTKYIPTGLQMIAKGS